MHNLDLHAVQLGLIALLSHFPASADIAPNRTEYNRVMRGSFDRLRDYQAAVWLRRVDVASTPRSRTTGARPRSGRAGRRPP